MKQIITSKKGFSIPELLLSLLIASIISVILTELISFNASSSRAFSGYNTQQYTVQDAFIRLNRDIEAASDVFFEEADRISGDQYKAFTLIIEGTSHKWTLESGNLYSDSDIIITGLTANSVFYSNSDYLTIVLKPIASNKGRVPINVSNPIVSQYSLKYK